ncbi:MAG: polyhydroxybutyrate depolymerase [Blastocatellia bacterium]|jgi:tetratricopeptide (TPR) repeat protein|nr:polyhydroxybutyrate depolymerase [Blastocatellia bacterium]
MDRWKFILLVILLTGAPVAALAQKIAKESLVSEGKKRSYYLYVPKSLQPTPKTGAPAPVAPAAPVTPATVPLVVLLHGSNHVGLSLAEKWNDLADKEGLIIVAPDSAESSHWSVPNDGPVFIHELVESIKARYPINSKKIYLFGHSGGAVFGLLMSLYESEYFAATAIHAGALYPESNGLVDLAKRKTPIQIQVGTSDEFFPLTTVRATRDFLNGEGFDVQLVEIPKHNHWYYDIAPQINQAAWDFLKAHELPAEPHYEEYKFRAEGRKSKEATEQYNRAVARHQAGDVAGAIAAYTRAIELDPKYDDAYNNRAVAYMSQNEYAAALADLTRSLELSPSDAAYNNRGSIYFSQNKVEEAIADFTASIKLKPSAEGFANRGNAYQRNQREALALADYEQAIKLNPNFGRAYVLRGWLLLQRGQAEAAQKDFDKGFQLDPSLHTEFDPLIKQLRPSP